MSRYDGAGASGGGSESEGSQSTAARGTYPSISSVYDTAVDGATAKAAVSTSGRTSVWSWYYTELIHNNSDISSQSPGRGGGGTFLQSYFADWCKDENASEDFVAQLCSRLFALAHEECTLRDESGGFVRDFGIVEADWDGTKLIGWVGDVICKVIARNCSSGSVTCFDVVVLCHRLTEIATSNELIMHDFLFPKGMQKFFHGFVKQLEHGLVLRKGFDSIIRSSEDGIIKSEGDDRSDEAAPKPKAELTWSLFSLLHLQKYATKPVSRQGGIRLKEMYDMLVACYCLIYDKDHISYDNNFQRYCSRLEGVGVAAADSGKGSGASGDKAPPDVSVSADGDKLFAGRDRSNSENLASQGLLEVRRNGNWCDVAGGVFEELEEGVEGIVKVSFIFAAAAAAAVGLLAQPFHEYSSHAPTTHANTVHFPPRGN